MILFIGHPVRNCNVSLNSFKDTASFRNWMHAKMRNLPKSSKGQTVLWQAIIGPAITPFEASNLVTTNLLWCTSLATAQLPQVPLTQHTRAAGWHGGNSSSDALKMESPCLVYTDCSHVFCIFLCGTPTQSISWLTIRQVSYISLLFF